jgi:hypothetical protein
MPFFKSTHNILKNPWEDEVFDPNWMDSDKLKLPKRTKWDYKREMQVEDVQIWEVLFEGGGAQGVYAAWEPYAEFYMVRVGWHLEDQGLGDETYYGAGAQELVMKRMVELNYPLNVQKTWVENEDLWLYQSPEPDKVIYSFANTKTN